MSEAPWYGAGLRFSCRRCGACCTGEPGHVWLGAGEAAALAARLGMAEAAFIARYARLAWGLWSLREEADGRCIFFEPGAGCAVYQARPRQCRTWPFWPRIVASPLAWEEEAASCPGMGSGDLFSAERIALLARDAVRPRRDGDR